MTRRTLALLATAALSGCIAVPVAAEYDDCPDDTVPTTSTTVPVATPSDPPPTTTVPGPVVDPIPEPQPQRPDWCVDTNGDGVGSWAYAVAECYTTAEAELWSTTVYQMMARYGISRAVANELLARLLTS